MFPISPYDAKRIADMRAEEAVRRMHHRRLVREAMANQRGWVPRQAALLLRWSGRLLVAAGRWLQQIGSPKERAYRRTSHGPRRGQVLTSPRKYGRLPAD